MSSTFAIKKKKQTKSEARNLQTSNTKCQISRKKGKLDIIDGLENDLCGMCAYRNVGDLRQTDK